MGLAELAEGLEVTTEQRDRGVAAVDRTDAALADRLEPVAEELPCDAEPAAALVEAYAEGADVATASATAGLPPITGAKTLHRFGEAVSPLSPVGHDVVRDWLDGRLPRYEAITIAGCSGTEFALAVYVETHDPLPAAREAVEGALTTADATADRQARLGDAVDDLDDLV